MGESKPVARDMALPPRNHRPAWAEGEVIELSLMFASTSPLIVGAEYTVVLSPFPLRGPGPFEENRNAARVEGAVEGYDVGW